MTQTNGTIIHAQGFKQQILLKCSYYPKQYRFNAISIKIFHRNRSNNPKICMERQKTLNSQAILKKNNKTRFQEILESLVIKTVWY